MKTSFGRQIFGLAAMLFAAIALVWREFNNWEQIRILGNVAHPGILLFFTAAIQFFGGGAIQFRRTARIGAAALGAIYFLFALLWVPLIAANPAVYDSWGNFFEQFSLVSGALIAYGSLEPNDSPRESKVIRIGYIGFAICVISFTLEQLFYLSGTASFVPKWIPPGQMFWAVLTTIAFALAALALLSGRTALLASRLLTLMLIGFGLLVWIPAPLAAPHQLISWAGNAQNLAITGAAWIVMDFLSQDRLAGRFRSATQNSKLSALTIETGEADLTDLPE